MSNGTPFTVEKIFALSPPRAQGYQVSLPALNLLSNRASSSSGNVEGTVQLHIRRRPLLISSSFCTTVCLESPDGPTGSGAPDQTAPMVAV